MDNIFPLPESSSCYVIAEAGLNHNGSVDIAKRMIDLAALSGANAVKFQKRTVSCLAVGDVLDARDDRFPSFGETYRQIREHLEFSFEDYIELKRHAEFRGLDFFVTAFDIEAVDFLERLGVSKYKLASHSLTNLELIGYLASLRKPTILSTGMAFIEEIDAAVDIFRRHRAPLALMHCVSAYPTPLSECNLEMLSILTQRYDLPVGYSGHEIGYLPTVVAVARGARLVERHFTLDKGMEGFDHKMSLAPDELIAMIRDIKLVPTIIGDGVKQVSETEMITRRKYHVSMASATKISTGTILESQHICWRNPGTGISSRMADRVLGKRAKIDIPSDVLLSEDMFE